MNNFLSFFVDSFQCIATLSGENDYVQIELRNGYLISGAIDFTIKVWNITTKTCVATLTGHNNTIISLLELRNGYLISGSADNTIKIWDIETKACIGTLTEHTGVVVSLIENW